jgi:hypothetical protein
MSSNQNKASGYGGGGKSAEEASEIKNLYINQMQISKRV